MKKIYILLISILLISLCALTLTSCGAKLRTPGGVHVDYDTLTLKWNKVKGATGYTLEISGIDAEITTVKNQYSLEKLEPGIYDIRIRANGDGKTLRNSAVYTLRGFERDKETGLKYELINNGTEYALVGGGSAAGDVVMENFYRKKPVTKIADKALYHNAKITSFTIGSEVKSIGEKAFTKCSKITEIVVPSNVTSIGDYAFQSCKMLTKVTLPNAVTSIGAYAFAWCSNLEEITVGNNLQTIGEYAFSNCNKLTTIYHTDIEKEAGKVIFPDSLLTVGGSAFADCLGITDVTFGKGVRSIYDYAFSGVQNLAKVDLGDSLVEISEAAFYGCHALTSVDMPDTLEYLGKGAFYGCTGLASVHLGAGVRDIGMSVFYGTALDEAAEDYFIIDGWLLQCKATQVVTANFNNNELIGIGSYAFYGCTKLQNAYFKGVQYVGASAFAGCAELYRVTFDDALLEIGDYAFAQSNIQSLTVGNSLTRIGNYAFKSCKLLSSTTLQSFVLPKSLTYIGAYAFNNTGLYTAASAGSVVYVGDWAVEFKPLGQPLPISVSIKEGTRGIAAYAFSQAAVSTLTMPNTVEYINRGAFYKCTSSLYYLSNALKMIDDYAFYGNERACFGNQEFTLNIPAGVTYIGRSAFYQCKSVVGLVIPENVEFIGMYAFYGCDALGASVEVQVGEELIPVTGFLEIKGGETPLVISDRAFQNCISLTSAILPDRVTSIGTRSFYNCELLEKVSLGNGITNLPDYAFYNCYSLKEVVTSKNLETVGNYTFRGCVSLEAFDLGSVKSVGRYAFYCCSMLEEIVLPNTLTYIGDYAFRGCVAVTTVVIPDTIVTIGRHAFYQLNEATFYVETSERLGGWNEKLNSSYRPFFWGCTLSDDNSYVVSIKVSEETLDNPHAKNGISNPERDGYTFEGWATTANGTVAYTSENVTTAPAGTVLYAIWAVASAE